MCCILPGTSSFLNLAGSILLRWGMWRSPNTSTNCKQKNIMKTVNSLVPGKFEWNFRFVIFKRILAIAVWGISCDIALILMSLDFTGDQSALVQVMAWCRQATSHYLSQCWPTPLSPYGVTRPTWVNSLAPASHSCNLQIALLLHLYFSEGWNQ